MYKKLIINDFKSSKLISIVIFAFILLTSFLLSTSGIILGNLLTSIDHFMNESKTPHYLQMHLGDLDKDRMDEFAKNNDKVSDYHVQGFLNIDSSDIYINGKRFLNNSQDNGFSVQNETFDFLLDIKGNIVRPEEGEIYTPLAYFLNGEITTGDEIMINDVHFKVMGFIRDSQMNSTLSSSKRFLINQRDYDKLLGFGREEHLIEFMLKDVAQISEFEGDYGNANLESNGPTITHTLFKMINAVNDGILISVLFLISFLVLIVSFLCIRFTLLSKIEDEYREIGVLKSIGMRNSNIKKLYISKYLAVAFLGTILGYFISLITADRFLEPIKLAMGDGGGEMNGYLFGLIFSILAFFVIVIYINQSLNSIKKITPAQSLKREISANETFGGKGFKLHGQSLLDSNTFLGLKSVVSRKKLYDTFAIILIVSAFIMILPNNLYNTISDKSFVSYLGVGKSDVLITIQDSDEMEEIANKLSDMLESDDEIEDFSFKYGKKYEMELDDGNYGRIQVILGDQSKYTPTYIQGNIPTGENQISLSYLISNELEKGIGDSITLIIDDQKREFEITGIYSDITNGGKTGQTSYFEDNEDFLWTSVNMNLKQGVDVGKKVEFYGNNFKNIRIVDINDYTIQIFGSTISSVETSFKVGTVLSIFLTFLITLLFLKMLVSKDNREISILKAMGFPSKEVKKQYYIGTVAILILGIALGSVLSLTIGQALANQMMSIFGVANLKFIINYLFVLIIVPITLGITAFLATTMGISNIEKIRISEFIKE